MPAPTPPRPTPTRLGRIGLVLLALCAAPAQAGPGDPVANASEIPALASLLQRTGWAATPELTGNIRIGDVYASTQQGQQWQAEGCLAAKARVSPYTQVELSTQLQMGVSVKMVVAMTSAWGALPSQKLSRKQKERMRESLGRLQAQIAAMEAQLGEGGEE